SFFHSQLCSFRTSLLCLAARNTLIRNERGGHLRLQRQDLWRERRRQGARHLCDQESKRLSRSSRRRDSLLPGWKLLVRLDPFEEQQRALSRSGCDDRRGEHFKRCEVR